MGACLVLGKKLCNLQKRFCHNAIGCSVRAFAPDSFRSTAYWQHPFVLFLGIAMSITALPVLARILEERNLQSTPVGPQSGTQPAHRLLWRSGFTGVREGCC